MASTDTRTEVRTAAHANGWELDERGGSDLYVREGHRVVTRWSKDGRLTNVAEQAAGADAYTPVKGGRAAAVELLSAPASVTTDPEELAVLQAAAARLDALPTDDAPQVQERADADASAPVDGDGTSTGFVDALGAGLAVGDRVEVAARGNNVRAKDVGQQGTVTGSSRTRVKVTWDASEDAPWKAILPALVTRQD